MNSEIKTWYNVATIENAKNKNARIDLYDEIGGWGITAKDFIDEINSLGDVENVDLHINSGGGCIITGNSICTALKQWSAHVTVYIDSLAASMASVVAMAGDEIRMADNAFLMIHNPWTLSMGDSEQLRKDADLLDKMKLNIMNAYSRSNYSAEELTELMDAGTWLTAQEALEAGFIDKIDGKIEMAASVKSLTNFNEKSGVKLPFEKMVMSINAQHESDLENLNQELTSANNQLAENATTIANLLSKVEEQEKALNTANENIESKKADHEIALAEAKKVTDAAVATKAAELMCNQTEQPATEQSSGEDAINTKEKFWEAYKQIEKTQGIAAKNTFYAENKHLLKSIQ